STLVTNRRGSTVFTAEAISKGDTSRPKEITVFCRVTVKKSAVDAQTIIPSAIEQWTRGELDGDNGLIVGREVSPFEIASAVNTVEPRLFVTKVE
ncbi:hypothetical protein LOR99_18855, partial [Proteus mirabilis]|nr:hypothetical protein [Proteus mirabilis]